MKDFSHMTNDEMFKVGIYEIALAVRMSCNGSADTMRTEDLERCSDYLQERIQHWIPRRCGVDGEFDCLMLRLAHTAWLISLSELHQRATNDR